MSSPIWHVPEIYSVRALTGSSSTTCGKPSVSSHCSSFLVLPWTVSGRSSPLSVEWGYHFDWEVSEWGQVGVWRSAGAERRGQSVGGPPAQAARQLAGGGDPSCRSCGHCQFLITWMCGEFQCCWCRSPALCIQEFSDQIPGKKRVLSTRAVCSVLVCSARVVFWLEFVGRNWRYVRQESSSKYFKRRKWSTFCRKKGTCAMQIHSSEFL